MLKSDPTRGYAVVPSDFMQYASQHDLNNHPLFASVGEQTFYAV